MHGSKFGKHESRRPYLASHNDPVKLNHFDSSIVGIPLVITPRTREENCAAFIC